MRRLLAFLEFAGAYFRRYVSACGVTAVIVVLVFALHERGIAWWPLAVLGVAVLVVGELSFYHRPIVGDRFTSEVSQRGAVGALLEIAVVLVAAVALTMISNHRGKPPVIPGEVTVHFSGDVEDQLRALLKAKTPVSIQSPAPVVNPAPNGITTVAFDKELEAELLAYLRNQHGSKAEVPLVLVVTVSLALGLALVVVLLALKKHIEATPLALAVAVAGPMMASAGKLSPQPVWVYGILVAAPIVAVPVVWVVWKLFFKKEYGGSLFVASICGSLLFLAWGAAIAVPRQAGGSHSGRPTTRAWLDTSLLSLRPTFGPNGTRPLDLAAIGNLANALNSQHVGRGDVLLLVGSADCTRRVGTNQVLADNRGDSIKNDLLHGSNSVSHGLDIEVYSPDQEEACQATGDARTVYPFLFRSSVVSK